jgi:tetratricopeptide (TPR) repeat protein
VLDQVREVDPRIGLSHDVLIAPFTGSGLFDWDRDLLIVALNPARGAEEAVVHAVANFRMLADARSGGEIEKAYREIHGAAFRQQFLADYRNWVLRVGRGKREALSARSYEFFTAHIGPPPAGPLVPSELAHLGVDERNAEAERLSKLVPTPQATPADVYRLAVLLWDTEQIEEAIRTMEKAVQAAPEDGRALYGLGLLCRKRRLVGAARKAFRNATRVAPDSLWSVYAHEALRRMV